MISFLVSSNLLPEKSLEVDRDKNRVLLERIFERVDKKIDSLSGQINEKINKIQVPAVQVPRQAPIQPAAQVRRDVPPVSFLFNDDHSMITPLPELLSGSSHSCMFLLSYAILLIIGSTTSKLTTQSNHLLTATQIRTRRRYEPSH